MTTPTKNPFAIIFALVVCLGVSSNVQAGLMALYTFEGNAIDVTGNGNNGTVFGASLTANGFQGSAYQFDGLNDFISIPTNVNPGPLPQLTWGAWVNADRITGNPRSGVRQVLSHDNAGFDRSLGMDVRFGGGVPSDWSTFAGSGGGLGSGIDVVIGDWVFLAASYDQVAGQVKLYVNDQVFSTTGVFGSGFSNVRIGSNPGFGEHFAGRIDNVFLFDEVLTDDRVADIRDSGFQAVPEPSSITIFGLAGSLGLFSSRRRRVE